MSAFSEAKELYDGDDPEKIMVFCAHNGIVFADNGVFLCAYPTCSGFIETGSKYDNETESKKGVDKVDTWYVYIASGDIKRVFDFVRPLKYIAYRRLDKKSRLIDFDKMRRLL